MSLTVVNTITFFDEDADQNAVAIVSVTEQTVSLCISLEEDGDVEISIPIPQSELLLSAIQKAISIVKNGTG